VGHSFLADASKSLVLAIDFQEPILAGVEKPEALVSGTINLIKLARLLNIPLRVTEQNPAKLGKTIEPVRIALGTAYKPIPKMSFSALSDSNSNAKESFRGKNFKDIIICGIETHICVLQTALDALHARYNVYIPADCVSAYPGRSEPALGIFRQAGGFVTDVETLAYMWLKEAGTVAFRQALPLLKKLRTEEKAGASGDASP